LKWLQISLLEIICTKTHQMSQTTKPLRGDQDEIKRVVKIWEVNHMELEKRTIIANG
jgi:hypothetical protein